MRWPAAQPALINQVASCTRPRDAQRGALLPFRVARVMPPSSLLPLFCVAGGQLHATPGCVEARVTALGEFSSKWEKEPLVLLKWLALQVGNQGSGA